mmetsp:Transcript_31222/g.50645  ORF Transcript_31222/g.50645 Transcript_31222/m.50645 type:complete len:86 (+) Transcript_31222:370-627(+)
MLLCGSAVSGCCACEVATDELTIEPDACGACPKCLVANFCVCSDSLLVVPPVMDSVEAMMTYWSRASVWTSSRFSYGSATVEAVG